MLTISISRTSTAHAESGGGGLDTRICDNVQTGTVSASLGRGGGLAGGRLSGPQRPPRL
jgi:hypothetical protein